MSLDAIGIVSQNIPESVAFFALLGVELKETGGPDHWEGITPSGVRIMVDSAELMKKLNSDWQIPSGCGVIICFKQESSRDVDEVYAKITEAGYKSVKEPWDAFWGQRYSSVLGPDGNQIDIFAAL